MSITVGSLVEQVKALLGVPADDDFFQNADIIDWLHEGAMELFPWLKEENLTSTHLRTTSYISNAFVTGNRFGLAIPSDFLRVKSVEVEKVQGSNNWFYTQYGDYNNFSASISKLNVLGMTNASDYRSCKWGSYVIVFPIPAGYVRLNYFAYPTKVINESAYADYPDFILGAIKDFAVSRGKSKEPNGQNEVVTYYNKFRTFKEDLQAAFKEVPPSTGITPEDKAKLGL